MAQLLDIVKAADDVGFETLVRALVRNEQYDLARRLDEQLAERFKSGMSSPRLSLFSSSSTQVRGYNT